MFKTTIAAAAAAVAFAPAAALAGPYVNVEANAGWTGDDYTSTTTDIHVGYEGEVGTASYTSRLALRSWLLMALTPKLSSLVKQVWVSLFRMPLASMGRFPS